MFATLSAVIWAAYGVLLRLPLKPKEPADSQAMTLPSVSVTDTEGNVIAWESAGSLGFKGSRKSTPYAAQMTAESVANKAMDQGMRRVDIEVKGHGSGRDMAARTFQAAGIEVLSIKDVTGQPHNGCRPPKRRRG